MPQSVDREFAIQVLDWWIANADAALMEWGRDRGRDESFCSSGPATDRLLARETQTRKVIKIVLGLEKINQLLQPMKVHNYVEVQTGLDLARRARGHLDTAAETAKYITGSSAPTMAADSLHHFVWDAASKLWSDGHHGQAVQRAATLLSAHVQDLVNRRDLNDSALMAQVFSPSPPESGRPRLRWPGNDTDLTVRSMRSGMLQFSQGIFLAIRNPATHRVEDTPAQEALEQLAVLSTLARWIDQCELLEWEPPTGS